MEIGLVTILIIVLGEVADQLHRTGDSASPGEV